MHPILGRCACEMCITVVRTVKFIRQQPSPDIFRESLLVSDSTSSRIFLGYRLVDFLSVVYRCLLAL